MNKGVRVPTDPKLGQIRLKVPREPPPLPGSGGGADMRPGQWGFHEKGAPDHRLLVLSQVQDAAPHGSDSPTYADVRLQRPVT